MDSISSTIKEEFFTCPICYDIYKDPKVLPCLHSFCKTCINNFISKRNTKTIHPCPVCREIFELQNLDSDELKTNFCLKNLIEVITSGKQNVSKFCTFCSLKGESNEATSQCLTCKDYLCSECADHRHRSTTLTINHKVVLLTEVISGKYNDEIRSKQQIPCSEHADEDLRYFCETCDVPICRDCIVLSHQSHKFIAPSDARKEADISISLLMSALKENLERFQLAKKNVSQALDKVLVEKQRFKHNLEKHVNEIIENIKESKLATENDLEEFLKSKQDSLRVQEESIERISKQLEESYSFCKNILKCGSDIEILTMKTEMNERLSKLKSFKSEESCAVDEIELPTLEIDTDGKIFRLLFHKREENERNLGMKSLNSEQEVSGVSDKQDKVLKSCTNFQTMIECKEKGDNFNPFYTGVSWMDKEKIIVADQKNQKVKIMNIQTKHIQSIVLLGCKVVCGFRDGVACKTEGGKLVVMNKDLKIEREFQWISTLLTCHPISPQLSWMSDADKICVYEKGGVQEFTINDRGRPVKIGNPMFGHVLLNGMYIISDWANDCVFIVRKSGYIERRKYCNPGSISSDLDNNIYVCDYQNSRIVMFTTAGVTLGTYISQIPNPRSIALKHDRRMLISNGQSIILDELKLEK
ncbi:E3 ubiquitin-protein ligase TRIM56-like [Saccostrea echinata]|uniref:E3 ubiquitin-protein ligase TRIM56-like n=1 Tax=Saccostrea echinata TaxID=191078 RepID=UPI002A82B410|nr:E3 ubiquitin-protein ligase TRIM56-like [Saccostrea echinata]